VAERSGDTAFAVQIPAESVLGTAAVAEHAEEVLAARISSTVFVTADGTDFTDRDPRIPRLMKVVVPPAVRHWHLNKSSVVGAPSSRRDTCQ
jgi:hypothetical protein